MSKPARDCYGRNSFDKQAVRCLKDTCTLPRRGTVRQAEMAELRVHVFALARSLASDPGLFERLAPQIWATGVSPVAWLVYGYAAAYGYPEALVEMLIRSFRARAADRASVGFIDGCLSATAERDPALLARAHEKLLAEPALTPYSVWLLLATPITPWVSARLLGPYHCTRYLNVLLLHFNCWRVATVPAVATGSGPTHCNGRATAALPDRVSTRRRGSNDKLRQRVRYALKRCPALPPRP
jgi:hypothetical protein